MRRPDETNRTPGNVYFKYRCIVNEIRCTTRAQCAYYYGLAQKRKENKPPITNPATGDFSRKFFASASGLFRPLSPGARCNYSSCLTFRDPKTSESSKGSISGYFFFFVSFEVTLHSKTQTERERERESESRTLGMPPSLLLCVTHFANFPTFPRFCRKFETVFFFLNFIERLNDRIVSLTNRVGVPAVLIDGNDDVSDRKTGQKP